MDRDLEHQLRNRLATALGYARLLADSSLSVEQRTWVNGIETACRDAGPGCLGDLAVRRGLSVEQPDAVIPLSPDDLRRLDHAIAQALAIMTDRRTGPGQLTLRCAEAEGRCSDCGDALAGTVGVELLCDTPVPGARHGWQALAQPVHAEGGHIQFQQEGALTRLALLRPASAVTP